MSYLALVRAPARPEDAATALAAATGLTLAEARMRLSPEPPALLARLPSAEAVARAAALRAAGLAAVAVEAEVPRDADRTVARSVALSDGGVRVVPRSGQPMDVAWPEVQAILRGLREYQSETERTEKQRTLSVGLTLATGGLPVSRTTTRTVHESETSFQQVILVYARDGRAAALAEGELDWSCLGPGLHPSSTANMGELARRLRARAPGAFYDERLLRLGRRPLPLVAPREVRSGVGTTAVTRRDTAGTLDVLAEILRRALAEGLLP